MKIRSAILEGVVRSGPAADRAEPSSLFFHIMSSILCQLCGCDSVGNSMFTSTAMNAMQLTKNERILVELKQLI